MKFFLFILAIFLIGKSFAQQQSQLVAIYNFSHLRDTTQKSFYNEQMMLSYNDNKSTYKSYQKFRQDSIAYDNIQKGEMKSSQTIIAKSTTEILQYDFENDVYYFIHPWLNSDTLIIKEKTDKIDWELIDSSDIIFGLKCNLAITSYKGRKYYVWYSNEIPIKAGPWRLNGLPGLIIKANDNAKQVVFTLSSIYYSNNSTVSLPIKSTYVTKVEFNNLMSALLDNPSAFVNSIKSVGEQPNTTTNVKVNNGNSNGSNIRRKKTITNPIELKE